MIESLCLDCPYFRSLPLKIQEVETISGEATESEPTVLSELPEMCERCKAIRAIDKALERKINDIIFRK